MLELHNSLQTGRKKRLKPTIEIRKQSIELAALYNAVQQFGGWTEVSPALDLDALKMYLEYC